MALRKHIRGGSRQRPAGSPSARSRLGVQAPPETTGGIFSRSATTRLQFKEPGVNNAGVDSPRGDDDWSMHASVDETKSAVQRSKRPRSTARIQKAAPRPDRSTNNSALSTLGRSKGHTFPVRAQEPPYVTMARGMLSSMQASGQRQNLPGGQGTGSPPSAAQVGYNCSIASASYL